MQEGFILTLVEVIGIQEYIFGSNQLAQNIGASEIVRQVTDRWLEESLPAESNLRNGEIQPKPLEKGDSSAEVIYFGGGNALILFRSGDEPRRFAKKLTRHALLKAPGLQLVIGHSDPFDWRAARLVDIHSDLRKRVGKGKFARTLSVPLPGLGVTAACVFTGQPAVSKGKVSDAESLERLVSAEVAAKLEALNIGKKRMRDKLELVRGGHEFVYNFDHFGTRGESSYIAVVHVDGNGMGKRFDEVAESSSDNRDYVNKLWRFSESIKRASQNALEGTVRLLLNNRKEDERNIQRERKWAGRIEVQKLNDGTPLLPFRPLVYGGDDTTFVCDGRLGLALGESYLKAFSDQELADGKKAFARAGIAIVKSHFPFSRAYELANALCHEAKEFIKGRSLSALDWHFAVSGLLYGLSETRKREYKARNGNSLLMRPIRLEEGNGDWRTWKIFQDLVREFQAGSNWVDRRNKVKALRDALREGHGAVQSFRGVYLNNQKLPPIPDRPDMEDEGWSNNQCGYFDAIEAMDFFVPLQEEVEGHVISA